MEKDLGTEVSVCIFSFNFIKYIDEAIQSVLMQKTSFQYKIIIADDCSTDGTIDILMKYANQFPDKIEVLINPINQGGTYNWINAFKHCTGKYIALLDGDDYFIDEYKLQKQYNLLEGNPNANICFHDVYEFNEEDESKSSVIGFENDYYDVEDILENGWFIRTASTFVRNLPIIAFPPNWVYDYPYRYDTILQVFEAEKGIAINIKECMSVYRKYSSGYSTNFQKSSINNSLTIIKLHNKLDEYTCFKYKSSIRKHLSSEYANLFISLIKKFEIARIHLVIESMFRLKYSIILKRAAKKIFKN